jgi:metallophosphoesterase superfamily enzyme
MNNIMTLVIGDIHLRDYKNNRDYLDCQVASIIALLRKIDYNVVIFLGDVFHFRKPSAREILAFKKILSYIECNGGWVHMILYSDISDIKVHTILKGITIAKLIYRVSRIEHYWAMFICLNMLTIW